MTIREFMKLVWERLKSIGRWCLKYLAAPGVALLLVVGAFILFKAGFKNLQIGGILGKLLGKKEESLPTVDTVPPDRVGPDGKPIPIGTPDAGGHTQVGVVAIKPPGLFSDPTTVEYVPVGQTEPVKVKLPEGVRNTDVKEIVVVSPEVIAVSVKDSSKVTVKDIKSLSDKYRKG